MIRLHLNEPNDEAWKEWRKKADDACQKLINDLKADLEFDFEITDLYKEQKDTIFRLFHGKCAYCEVRLTGNQPGDVEHYRPKKGVVDDNNKPVVHPHTGKKHRGYYWLAYAWHNLLLACNDCNKIKRTKDLKRIGKGNRFPLPERGFRAFEPGEESREEPLLLNPLYDDPESHLVFDQTGIVSGLTDKGKKTVELLGLYREGLPEGRREAIMAAQGIAVNLITALVRRDKDEEQRLRSELDEYWKGAKPFSAIVQTVVLKPLEATFTTHCSI